MTAVRVDREFLLESFLCCVPLHGAIYCSAPITSGKRHLQWLRAVGQSFDSIDHASKAERELHERAVIEPNARHAQAVIDRLRKSSKQAVIDPTAYPAIEGWTQPQWHEFWSSVISRYAASVVFLDDWQYSNGCSEEFLTAVRLSLPRLDERGNEIAVAEAAQLLTDAIGEIKLLHGEPRTLIRIAQALQENSDAATSETAQDPSDIA